MQSATSAVSRAPRPSSLADVLDLILDKGLVIDAYVRVSLAGIELLTIDARVVVASVDTYLRFAEAVNRLDLGQTEEKGLPALFGHGDNDQGQDGNHSSNGSARSGRSGRSGGEEGRRGSQEHPQLREGPRERGNQRGTDEDGGGLIERISERARR